MSTTTARVKQLLNEVETSPEETEESEDSEPLTRSDLKHAVKEGVVEALDERERGMQGAESGEEDEMDESSSGGGSFGRWFVLLLTLGAIVVLFRRRMAGESS